MKKIKLPWILAIIVATALVLFGAQFSKEVTSARDSVFEQICKVTKYLTGKLKRTEDDSVSSEEEN